MRFHRLFVAVVCMVLSACAPSLDQTLTPTPSETAQPSQTFSPAETATPTPVPSATIAPPPEQDFYRLRIEYSSTSDWTTLELHNPDGILAARLMETQ